MKRTAFLWIISIILIANTNIFSQTFTYSGPAVSIPDNDAINGGWAEINASGMNPVSEVDYVTINLTHTWDSDLEIVLEFYDNSWILSNGNGGSGANYTNTIFRTGAYPSITTGVAPFTGTYLPQIALPKFIDNFNPNGKWTLHVYDLATGDIGTINSWSITFKAPTCATVGFGTLPATMNCSDAAVNLYASDLITAGGADFPTMFLEFNVDATLDPTTADNTFTLYEDGIAIYSDVLITDRLTLYFTGPYPSPTSVYYVNVCNTNYTTTWLIYDGNGQTLTSGSTTNACNNSATWSPHGLSSWTCTPTNGITATGDWGAAIFDPSVVGAGTYTITYNWNNQGSGGNACSGSGQHVVTVANPWTATWNSPGTVCASGGSLNLNTYLTGSAGGNWSGTGVSGNTFNPLGLSGPINITYTVGNSSACSATVSHTITVSTNPIATAVSNGPVCVGSTLTLTGGPSSMTSYSWSGPNGFTSSSQNPTVSGSATTAMSGTYTITVTNSSGCTNTTTTSVSVNTLPVPSASNNSPICEGNSLTISGLPNSMTNYSWSGPNGFTSTSQNPTVSGSATTTMSGIYTLTITDGNGCTNTSTTSVTVNASPVAVATSNGPVCEGTILNLTGLPGGMISYSWSGPNGFTSNLQNPTVSSNTTTAMAGTYTLTVLNSNNCTNTTTTAVTVNTNPTPTITGSLTFCNGSSTTLNAGPGYSSYTWLPSGNTQTINVSSAGTYSVTVTNASGCTGTASVIVTVSSSLSPSITGSLNFCTGSSTILDAGVGFSTYTWIPAGNTQTINVTSAGNYSVTVTDANGCSGTDNVTVTENTNPTPIITGTLAFCTGNSTTLDAGVGYSSYVWLPSGNTQTINVTSAGNYAVTVTDANGCSGTNNIDVIENSNPTPTISGALSFCTGGSTTLDAGSGFSNYTWLPSGNTQTINVTAAGTYSVTVTNTNGCTGYTSVNVTVNSSLTPSITGVSSFCSGSSTTLDAGSGYSSYTWLPSGNTQTINVTSAGNYAVTVTDANGCSGTDNINVTENSTPSPIISGALSFCTGGSTILDAGSGYTNYTWLPSGNTQTINVIIAGTYSVTVTNANGCSGTTSVNVTESTNLSPVITGALAFCVGGSTTLDAGSGYTTYLWSPSGNTQTINVTSAGTYTVTVTNTSGCTGSVSANVSVSIINSTTTNSNVSCLGGNDGTATIYPTGGTPNYSYNWSPSGGNTATATNLVAGNYSVTIYDANSCTNVNYVTITEPSTAVSSLILSTTNPNCFGGNDGSITTSTTGGTPPYNYLWSNGEITQNISNISAGSYYLTVNDANNCQLIINTTITNPLAITINGVSGIGTNNFGYINVTVLNGTSPISYIWSNGDTTQNISNLNSGTYFITITDANTCFAIDTFNLDVPFLDLEIPTAISPNNDQINDNFEIKHIEQYSNISLEIFNRWGDKIFLFSGSGIEYYSSSNRWDGKFKGKNLPMGGYIYILKISGLEPINGVVSIIR